MSTKFSLVFFRFILLWILFIDFFVFVYTKIATNWENQKLLKHNQNLAIALVEWLDLQKF